MAEMKQGPRPFVGLVSGIAAGLVASAAIAAFRAASSPLLEQKPEGAAKSETGHGDEARDFMVQTVAGAVVGGIYGLLSEYRPEASAGFGSAYGIATATLFDPVAFDPNSGEEPEAFGVAAPVIFGVVLEGIRALIAGRRG